MFFIEPTTAISLAEAAFENRQYLIRSLKRLRLWLRRGTLNIVVFGPGGAGKTTLGLFLSGTLDLSTPRRYEESIDRETYKLGNLVGRLLVPPGQSRRRDHHWPELFRGIETGSSTGIINVVAAGYHSFQALSYREHRIFREGMTDRDFLKDYRASGMQDEINIAKSLLPRLLDAKNKIWMLTVVTKQDLWWAERQAIKSHYTSGEYSQIIEEVSRKRGEQNFVHEYLSVAPVMSNFMSGTGELLASTTAGYDQNIQCANLNELLKTVQSLAKRKQR